MKDLDANILDIILDVIDENDISAYEIGKATGLNVSGLNKIINRETKNPQQGTIRIIWEYLEKRQLGRNLDENGNPLKKVEEPQPQYKTNLSQDEVTKLLMDQINLLNDRVESLKEKIGILAEKNSQLEKENSELKKKK